MEENQSQEIAQAFTIHGERGPLFKALAAAQGAFKPVIKTKENPFFKSVYADLSDVLAACVPALNAHGLALIQPPHRAEGQDWVLTTLLVHESGSMIEVSATIPPVQDWQKFGSAVTYCRRYVVGGLLGVAPESDDDGNEASDVKERAPTSRATPPPMPSATKPVATQPKLAAAPAAAKPEAKPAPAAKPSDVSAVAPGTPVSTTTAPVSTGTPIVKVGDGSVVAPAAKPAPAQSAQSVRNGGPVAEESQSANQGAHAQTEHPAEPPLADPADVISDDGVVYPTWAEPADKTPATDSSRKNLGATARELRFTRPLLDELCRSTIGIPAGLMSFEADFKRVQAAIEKAGARK